MLDLRAREEKAREEIHAADRVDGHAAEVSRTVDLAEPVIEIADLTVAERSLARETGQERQERSERQ